MMNSRCLVAGLLALAAGGCRIDSTLTIRPDGTCTVRMEVAQHRAAVVRVMDEEWSRPGQDEEKPAARMTDAELEAAIRARLAVGAMPVVETKMKLDAIEVKDGKVRVALSATAPTVKALATDFVHLSPLLVGADQLVAEKDPKGRLRLSVGRREGSTRNVQEVIERFQLTEMLLTCRIVAPGKVLTSSLPQTKDNATWLSLDAMRPESEKALAKYLAAPTVVTAELGGLKLDARIDSRELARPPQARDPRTARLPLVDAPPGFIVSPISVTTVSYRFLKDHRKLIAAHKQEFAGSAGLAIAAEILLPKDRRLLSAESARVVEAVDGQGRSIEPGPEQRTFTLTDARGERLHGRVPMTLRLGLPAPDAGRLERLAGEAVLVTSSGWKAVEIPNLAVDPKKEIELAGVVPGCFIAITEIKGRQIRFTLRGKGHTAVFEDLAFALKLPGGEEWECRKSGHSLSSTGNVFKGTMTISVAERGKEAAAGMTLVVRAPDRVRRERVRFTLERLPLHPPAAREEAKF